MHCTIQKHAQKVLFHRGPAQTVLRRQNDKHMRRPASRSLCWKMQVKRFVDVDVIPRTEELGLQTLQGMLACL